MSYILEALKKSDQERQNGTIPDLQSRHTVHPRLPGSRRNRTGFPWITLSICLFTFVLLSATWMYREHLPFTLRKKSATADFAEQKVPTEKPAAARIEQSHDSGQPPPGTAEPEAEAKAEPPANEHTEQTVLAPSEQMKTQRRLTLEPAPIVLQEMNPLEIPEQSRKLSTIPLLEELPAKVKKDLPRLKVAGHTYSADAAKRMIIINNSIRREGDVIENGLKLEEITWDGIILNHMGTQFQMITTQ
jgi:general secretion pathway protein B